MERPQFFNDEIFHIYNRGVEKRIVFLNSAGYSRFIRSLFEFNDTAPATNLYRVRLKSDFKQRKPLVEILCFCLMPNHYHLLLRQLVDGGITEFMRKIGTGYTNYFNLKNNRVGPLFQGKFKAVHVENQSHLLYLPHYIHLNPLDLITPEWRDRKIKDVNKAIKFLNSYHWSSYLDYTGKKNFPLLIKPDFIFDNYGYQTAKTGLLYHKEIIEWMKYLDLEPIQDIILE